MNRLFRWGILIALVILAISSFIALRIVFGDNAGTVVPSLVGLQSEEAVQRLSDIGLDAEVADQPDSNYPEGTVFWQSISPGKKAVLGMVVTLRVSRGLPRAPIPDVRGKEFAAAVQELDSKGFKLGAVIRVADRLKQPGTVIAQNPAAPAMAPGSRMVDLLVSEGGPERAE
ncbi:MAG: PASTA domain-containing protein, partial [Synergistaceae bacterium]|nr:PASTA domain-containing protein [Synergistaceae bacterium]